MSYIGIRIGTNFSPLSLNPALWLDATQLSLVEGDLVSTWLDYSGNGRHATAATDQRPTYRAILANGRPTLEFNGTTNGMDHGLTSVPGEATTIIVTKKITTQTSYRTLFTAGGVNGTAILSRFATSTNWGTFASGEKPANTAAGTSLFRILTLADAGTYGTFYLNGVVDGGWTGAAVNSSSMYKVGTGDTGQNSNSYISEVICFLRILNNAEMFRVHNALKIKYGI